MNIAGLIYYIIGKLISNAKIAKAFANIMEIALILIKILLVWNNNKSLRLIKALNYKTPLII